MNAETFCEHFATFTEAPGGVAKLRELILQLAVQGKLVPQDENDESVSALLVHIEKQKSELIKRGLIPKESPLPSLPDDNLPFGIPPSWQWIRLESVCEIITKGSSPTWQGVQYVDADDGVMFVTSENVGNYVLRKMDEPKFVERKFNEMEPRSILQRDDLLVNLVGGSIGRSAIYDRDDDANINQAVGIIRLVRGDIAIERWYLLHYLNSPASLQIMFAEQVETARANLSLTNMKHFLVPVPPLAEQRRIVAKVDQLLGLCDELAARQETRRTARERLVVATLADLTSPRDTTDRIAPVQRLQTHFDTLFDTTTSIPHLRQTILQLAVQGKLIPQDPNDEPAELLLERARIECVDSNDIGDTADESTDSSWESDVESLEKPLSWKLVRFADIISYGPRNGISPKPVERVTQTKSLTLSATTSGTFDGRHVKYLSEEFPADSFLWLKDGDILIQRSNSENYVGVAAIYRGKANDFVYPDLMMKVRTASCIDASFAHHVLMSPSSRDYFRRKATGTSGSMRKINKSTVKSLPFPLPPLAEQKRIVAKVTELLAWCDTLERQLQATETASTQLLTAAVQQLLSAARHQPA